MVLTDPPQAVVRRLTSFDRGQPVETFHVLLALVLEERLGLRVAIGPPVDRRDRGIDLDPGRDQVATELERLAAYDSADTGHHGPEAQRLLHDRLQIALIALGEAGAKPVEHRRVSE